MVCVVSNKGVLFAVYEEVNVVVNTYVDFDVV